MIAKDEATRLARDELATFLREHAREGADIEHSLTLIDEALVRSDRPLPASKDIREKAEDLANAATRFAKALQIAAAVVVDGDGVARERAESIWPFLRIAELMGPQGFKGDAASALRFGSSFRQVRSFDIDVGKAPSLMFQVKRVEQQARHAVEVFNRRGAPSEAIRKRLGVELASIWKHLSGKKAARSGDATFDKPRGFFSRFVKLAILTTDWDERKLRDTFTTIAGARKEQN